MLQAGETFGGQHDERRERWRPGTVKLAGFGYGDSPRRRCLRRSCRRAVLVHIELIMEVEPDSTRSLGGEFRDRTVWMLGAACP